MRHPTHRRKWMILAALFVATASCYLIRQTLGCTVIPMAAEMGFTPEESSRLISSMIMAYALAHLATGFVIDRVKSVKIFFAVCLGLWALCAVGMGAAKTYGQMQALCLALGLVQAVNFPLCLKVVAEAFEPSQRAFATGIFGSGAYIATLIAPKWVIYISSALSWHYAFLSAAILPLAAAVIWLAAYRHQPSSAKTTAPWVSSLKNIIKLPGFWTVVAMGMGLVPCLNFITQWLPHYFTANLGAEFDQSLGNRLTLIYLSQDLGMWLSGIAVYFMAAKGMDLLKAQKCVVAAAAPMMLSILWLAPGCGTEIFAAFTFGLGICLATQQTLKQYVLPGQTASVAALVGFIETLFAALFISIIGSLSSALIVWIIAILAMAAVAAALTGVRPQWMLIQ